VLLDTARVSQRAEITQFISSQPLSAKALREEVATNLQRLGNGLFQTIEQISQSQKERLDRVSGSVAELTQRSGEQQEALRRTVDERLDAIGNENTEKLEQMRLTVDEKLQTARAPEFWSPSGPNGSSTLDQRITASFKTVSDWLEQVYKSMGEMRTLASGVGDLTRLLTNVKLRGTWAEVTLGNLLEEMMAPDQYGKNVEIVPGSNRRVEYAIRLRAKERARSGYRSMPSFRSRTMEIIGCEPSYTSVGFYTVRGCSRQLAGKSSPSPTS
jgi:DNA recombination protein RmuC